MASLGLKGPSITVQPQATGGGAVINSRQFSGSMTGSPMAAKIRFFGDVPDTSYAGVTSYPVTVASTTGTLRVKPTVNTLTVATTFTVLVNGVASAVTLVIPAGVVVLATVTAALVVVPGDVIDLRMAIPAGSPAALLIRSASTLVFS